MVKRTRNFFLVFLLVCTFFFPLVSSINIGISPATINFDQVIRAGYAERPITISTDSEKFVDVIIEPRGEISTWLNFSEWNFSVSLDSPKSIIASVNPPADIPNGNYSGFIRFRTTSVGEGMEGYAVGMIKSTLDLYVLVTITDREIVECVVSNVQINSVERGDDLVLKLNILNKGNVRLRTQVLFNIWDFDQLNILEEKEFFSKEILPTREETVEFRFKSGGLDIGQYWSDLSVIECLYDSFLTFDILEEGALSANGILISILTKKEARIRETVPIEANFKNIGEKEVSAQFRGRVSRDGRVIQVLESPESIVGINEIEQFRFYFTPQRSGKYIISGRVYYSGKKTFESSTALNVAEGFNWVPLVYSFLIILMIFLIYKVRKERRKLKMKLKYLK